MEKLVARINDVNILIYEYGEKPVPIKPICTALGVDFHSQKDKINSDPILSSTKVLSTSVAADNKKREMLCLPLEFTFGWIFSISEKNVKPEARENLIRYKLECYHALFLYFTDAALFIEEKNKAIEDQLEEVERINTAFNTTKNKLKEAKEKLNEIRSETFESWKANGKQLSILDFTEE
jgi:hypothetical protein